MIRGDIAIYVTEVSGIMRYAIVASAWLFAWGVIAPQSADAGVLVSVAEDLTAATPLAGCVDLDCTNSSQPVGPAETVSILDRFLGVLQVPSGAQAPSNTNPLTGSASAPAITESQWQGLSQTS